MQAIRRITCITLVQYILAIFHSFALLEEDTLLDFSLGEVREVLALLVSEALVLTLMLALHVLAVDHDDVVDVEGTDGGAAEEVAVHIFAAAFLTFWRKVSLQMRTREGQNFTSSAQSS